MILRKRYILWTSVALTAFVTMFTSCNDGLSFTTSLSARLAFSSDTVRFDTVFTSLGSTTTKLMVYNRNTESLKISSVKLSGRSLSSYRINVDGQTNVNNEFAEVEVPAKDSIYIFVSVTINPTKTDAPTLVEDSLLFTVNGNLQRVRLLAYGQNMEIFRNKVISHDTVLTAQKPYLIYGDLKVDSLKTLTLQPGCRLYFHNGANLMVYGNLKAVGTPEHPVLMRGDRLDKMPFTTPVPYNYVSGQWGGIYLMNKKSQLDLQFVQMNSGYAGIVVSNEDLNLRPLVKVNSCRIHNFQQYGLWALNADVTVTNTEISNAGSYCVYLSGGTHSFLQSTIANYFNNSEVQPVTNVNKPAVMINNLDRVAPMKSTFINCVIGGTAENEFDVQTRFENLYDGVFQHCYIKKAKAIEWKQFENIRWFERKDTLFKCTRYDAKDRVYFDFTPDSVSPLRKGIADPNVAAQFPSDLNGNNRNSDGSPDVGAYEWKPRRK